MNLSATTTKQSGRPKPKTFAMRICAITTDTFQTSVALSSISLRRNNPKKVSADIPNGLRGKIPPNTFPANALWRAGGSSPPRLLADDEFS